MVKTTRSAYEKSAREQLRASQEVAAESRQRILIVIIIVLALSLIAALVVLFITRNQDSPSEATSQDSPSEATSTPGAQIVPPHADTSLAWYEFTSDNVKPDALIVDEHYDFHCPWCKFVAVSFEDSLMALAESGDIVLRIHLRTFVGTLIHHNDYSVRAARGAACADQVGKFHEYGSVVFSHQETSGFTDQELGTDYAEEAGITGDDLTGFQACYTGQQTKDFVDSMEAINSTSTTTNHNITLPEPVMGTPTIFVNGIQLDAGYLISTTAPYGPVTDNSPSGLLALLQAVAAS